MILSEAYELMDLLIDKADQPYFTNEEKDKFLDIAISEFITFHYQKMTTDEDSRRAMATLIDYISWNLTASEIVSGDYVSYGAPALSMKYQERGQIDVATGVIKPNSEPNDFKGYWKYGAQYIFPKNHLYVLALSVSTYNKEELMDSSGILYSGVTSSDVVFNKRMSVKNKSVRDYYEDSVSDDPFNKLDKETISWAYIENKIVISNSKEISSVAMQVINTPPVAMAFSSATIGTTTTPNAYTFNDFNQKQIIDIAVDKMIQVDVGLMTPPS